MTTRDEPMLIDTQWSEHDTQLIDEWITYGQQIVERCNELRQQGGISTDFPKRPKQNINSLFDEVKLKKPKMSGIELHQYLTSKLVSDNYATAMPDLTILSVNTTLDDMLPHLKSGYEYIQRKNSRMLGRFIDYGVWLNAAYDKFMDNKIRGLIKVSWAEWLQNNVGISQSYAGKLRAIGHVCEKYPKMKTLGISIDELYHLRGEISKLFLSNIDNCVAYWQNA